jgi:hypothetical protein
MQITLQAPGARVLALPIVGLMLCISARAQLGLSLQVRKGPSHANHVIVGSPPPRSYVGLLRNTDSSPMLLQIIQMAGRPGANGRFGACYLEQWNSSLRRWDYLPQPIVATETFEVKSIVLKSGVPIQVCDALFSSKVGQPGICYRFMLQVQMRGHDAPSVLSRSFKVGGAAPSEGKPPSCDK